MKTSAGLPCSLRTSEIPYPREAFYIPNSSLRPLHAAVPGAQGRKAVGWVGWGGGLASRGGGGDLQLQLHFFLKTRSVFPCYACHHFCSHDNPLSLDPHVTPPKAGTGAPSLLLGGWSVAARPSPAPPHPPPLRAAPTFLAQACASPLAIHQQFITALSFLPNQRQLIKNTRPSCGWVGWGKGL